MKLRYSALAIALANTQKAALTVVAACATSLAGVVEKTKEMSLLSGLGLVGGFCPSTAPV